MVAVTLAPTNIDSAGVETRLRQSVYAFTVTLAALVIMRTLGAPIWSFWLLALPFGGAFSLAYQGLFKT